jgi:uncharacterized membrane protein HdeD (DUF308 family)
MNMSNKSKTSAILSGILSILIGLILILMPGVAVGTLIIIFAFYLLLYGIFRVALSISAEQGSPFRLPWLIIGALAILAGIGLFLYPGISLVLLAYYIAFYAIIIGILEVVAGFRIRQNIGREILLIIAGILSVLFGVYLFAIPGIGLAFLVLLLGWYELIYGIILLIYGLTRKTSVSNY